MFLTVVCMNLPEHLNSFHKNALKLFTSHLKHETINLKVQFKVVAIKH